MRGWAFCILAAAGCTDASIDMHLRLPTPSQAQGFDVSCVSAVRVDVQGNDQGDQNHPADTVSKCIDLATQPKSWTDIQRAMSGQFSFGLPKSGLAGVVLRGSIGSCNDPSGGDHESVFYGGAASTGDSMTIPVVPNISCDKPKTYNVRPVDLLALTMTKTCTTPTDTPLVSAGDFRPLMLGDAFPSEVLDWGTSEVAPTNGVSTVDSFAGTVTPDSCVAMMYDGMASGGGTCVNPSAPALCAQAAGELDAPAIPYAYALASVDPALAKQYGPPVFGAAWETSATATKAPIAGATVDLEDPTQGTIVYVQRGANRFEPLTGMRATGADGLFIAYIKGPPTGLIVKAANHVPQRVVVASGTEMPGTVIAALPHM